MKQAENSPGGPVPVPAPIWLAKTHPYHCIKCYSWAKSKFEICCLFFYKNSGPLKCYQYSALASLLPH